MTESSTDPRVLVVDDEADVADVYALRLRDRYETETAYGGHAALERLGVSPGADGGGDDGGGEGDGRNEDGVDVDVDVVLLDRRMPKVSGDDVLEVIRDRGLDCRVIMTTAVDPDFDIVEMPFDDYLCKPVGKADLVTAIEQQLTATRYDERLTEYLEVTSKLGLLEAEKTDGELAASDEMDALRDRADELKAELDEVLAEFEDAEAAFKEIDTRSE